MKRILLIAMFLASPLALLQADPFLEDKEVFPGTPADKPNYRIPAIITAPNGDILVFVEKRNDGIGDYGNIDIAMRRSRDLGRTWEPIEVIFDDGDNSCNNVTPCVDSETGRLFLFFLRDCKRFVYIYSDDSGETWSDLVDIHDQVTEPGWDTIKLSQEEIRNPQPPPENATPGKKWSHRWHQRYGIGPGSAAIQLKQGPSKGRILVPCRHKVYENDSTPSYTHVFYSDDHGKTWQLGGTRIMKHGNEAQLVELADGSIMMNSRNGLSYYTPENARRIVAVSRDGGITWPEVWHDEGLVSLPCHAAILTYHHKDSPHNGLVLFSNPVNSLREPKHPYGRYNMTVRWSTDNAATWSAGRPVYPYNAAYSDLTILPDGSIGMIYEWGERGTNKYWQTLHFARFNLEWLMAPPRAKWDPDSLVDTRSPKKEPLPITEGNSEFKRRMELARQGDAGAQLYVGNRYDRGRDGVRQDKDEGLKWILASATQGNPMAQSIAGMRLKDRKEYVEACKWTYLAIQGGDKHARNNLPEIEKFMKKSEIAEAKKRAAEFEPKKVLPD